MSPPGRGLPNREASKICEEQLDLNTALGRTRASGFQMNKNQKSDEKSGPRSVRTQVLKAQIHGTMFWTLWK